MWTGGGGGAGVGSRGCVRARPRAPNFVPVVEEPAGGERVARNGVDRPKDFFPSW